MTRRVAYNTLPRSLVAASSVAIGAAFLLWVLGMFGLIGGAAQEMIGAFRWLPYVEGKVVHEVGVNGRAFRFEIVSEDLPLGPSISEEEIRMRVRTLLVSDQIGLREDQAERAVASEPLVLFVDEESLAEVFGVAVGPWGNYDSLQIVYQYIPVYADGTIPLVESRALPKGRDERRLAFDQLRVSLRKP